MWGRIIADHPDIVCAGIVDPDPARIDAYAHAFGAVPSFADLGAALESVAADAVLLVTPPDGHLDQARLVFAAGLPLLAEKPLALDLGEAREIVRARASLGVSAERRIELPLPAGQPGDPPSGRGRRFWARPVSAPSSTIATATGGDRE